MLDNSIPSSHPINFCCEEINLKDLADICMYTYLDASKVAQYRNNPSVLIQALSLPPSNDIRARVAVSFLRTFITKHTLPNRQTLSPSSGMSVLNARGQNTTPSPVLSPAIVLNPSKLLDMSRAISCFK